MEETIASVLLLILGVILGQGVLAVAHNEPDTLDAHLEQEHGVRYPDRCETCKILAIELQERLQETGKSHDVIETGYPTRCCPSRSLL